MAKQYRIDVIVNTSQTDGAFARAERGAKGLETASERAAREAERASERAAKAAERTADRQARAAEKAVEREARARLKESERQEREADKQVDRWERNQERAAQAAERSAKRAADARQKEAQRAAAAEEKAWTKAFSDEDVARRVHNAKVKRDNDRRTWEAIEGAGIETRRKKQLLTEEEVAIKVHNEKIRQANQRRVDAAMEAAGVEERGFKNGWEGANMLASGVLRATAAFAGMTGVASIVKQIGDAARQAADEQKRLTDEVIKQRDAEAELQALKGKTSTTQSTVESARWSAEVGYDASESNEYRKAFLGSGEQFRGRMGDKSFAEYEKKSAQLGLSKKIDPRIMADAAGSMLGFRDYRKKFGDKAADVALGDLNQAVEILQHGSGDTSTLVRQMKMLSAASLSEDELSGTFTSPKDVAIAISTMAEVNPEESETMVRAANRGLRDFDGKKSAGILKQAGIDSKTPMLEAVKRLAPVVKAEAKAKGVKVGDVLAEHFEDERTRKALGAFINKGVDGGVIAEREKYASDVEGPAPALNQIESSRKDRDGFVGQRLENQRKALAEAKQGAKNVELTKLRTRAEANLIDRGEGTNSFAANWGDRWRRFTDGPAAWTDSMPTGREARVNDEVDRMLTASARKAGMIGKDEPLDARLDRGLTHEGRDLVTRQVLARFRQAGVDPATGEKMGAAGGGSGADWGQAVGLLQQLVDQGNRRDGGGGMVPAAPPVMAAPRGAPAGVPAH